MCVWCLCICDADKVGTILPELLGPYFVLFLTSNEASLKSQKKCKEQGGGSWPGHPRETRRDLSCWDGTVLCGLDARALWLQRNGQPRLRATAGPQVRVPLKNRSCDAGKRAGPGPAELGSGPRSLCPLPCAQWEVRPVGGTSDIRTPRPPTGSAWTTPAASLGPPGGSHQVALPPQQVAGWPLSTCTLRCPPCSVSVLLSAKRFACFPFKCTR